jgi:redox-sensitive bicupin YhaK (pirin superfamily)
MTERSPRSAHRVAPLAVTRPGDGFDLAVSFNRSVIDADLGPFVDLTLFDMSQPVFRPHPHAGFSAVTYMLESSDGAFRNRWTAGADELIGPGALHWTRTGSGMLHEEVPTDPGTVCRGVQMFVKQPAARELDPPQAFHLDTDEVTEVGAGPGTRVRLLAGALGGVDSGLGLPDDVLLLDVHLDAGASLDLPVPRGWNALAFLFRGDLDLDGRPVTGPAGIVFGPDGEDIGLDTRSGAHLLVGAGAPVGDFVASGPFMMSTPARLDDARQRYAAGQMGRLDSSF